MNLVEIVLSAIAGWVTSIIEQTGYAGVVVLMAAESAAIPIPSEIIMPFAGFLVFSGRFNLWGVALAGALGNLLGSLALYWVGASLGRNFLWRYGRYLFISHLDIARAEKFFGHFGAWATFFGRFLPVVRTYISFPAGVAKMELKTFSALTFLGSFVWSLLLAEVGRRAGQNWENIRGAFRGLEILVLLALVSAGVWWIWRHWKGAKSGL